MQASQPVKTAVTAAAFGAKFRSKREIYVFFTVDVKAYLCGCDCLTIYFLKDLLRGKRKCKSANVDHPFYADIKCDAVKYLYAPQYENLSIERILEQARKNPVINDYLPEDRDMHKVPRQWLLNLAFTLLGEPFRAWVKDEIEHRNEEIAKKRDLLIEMEPEVAAAFHASVNISSKCINSLMTIHLRM